MCRVVASPSSPSLRGVGRVLAPGRGIHVSRAGQIPPDALSGPIAPRPPRSLGWEDLAGARAREGTRRRSQGRAWRERSGGASGRARQCGSGFSGASARSLAPASQPARPPASLHCRLAGEASADHLPRLGRSRRETQPAPAGWPAGRMHVGDPPRRRALARPVCAPPAHFVPCLDGEGGAVHLRRAFFQGTRLVIALPPPPPGHLAGFLRLLPGSPPPPPPLVPQAGRAASALLVGALRRGGYAWLTFHRPGPDPPHPTPHPPRSALCKLEAAVALRSPSSR